MVLHVRKSLQEKHKSGCLVVCWLIAVKHSDFISACHTHKFALILQVPSKALLVTLQVHLVQLCCMPKAFLGQDSQRCRALGQRDTLGCLP